MRAGDVGGNPAEEALDRAEPGEVELEERPPLAAGLAREVPVLGAQVDRQAPEPLLEIPPPAPADDVDVRRRDLGESTQQAADLRSREGEVWMELELPERPVVVEQDRPPPRAEEPALDPLLRLVVDRTRPPRGGARSRIAPETREEAFGPALAVQRLDTHGHGLQAPLPLARR